MRYAWHLRQDYFGSIPDGGWIERAKFRARESLLDRIQQWDRRTCDRVTHFVAISRAVARRIDECYGRSSEVIYPPVDTDFYQPTRQPREDFYLALSALVPYKRIDLAVAACRRLGRRLVVVGTGSDQKKLVSMTGPGIEFRGWQSNEVIRELLCKCRALLFPTHEDFGIVPVEAQACGAPVIALHRGGATETVLPADNSHPGSGVFFADPTVESLSTAIEWFETHSQQLDPQLARRQAEKFSSTRFEQDILAYINRVMEGRART
jgi:glycosyltransferase involved in cell wall biosynthesis